MKKVYVSCNGFIRATDSNCIVDGEVAYDETGAVVATAVSPGSVIPQLLNMGFTKETIYIKTWVKLGDIK